MKLINLSTVAAAVVLSFLCLALPAYHWSSIPSSISLQILSGAAAVAIGVCKLTFIPLSVDCFTRRQFIPSTLLFTVALVALFISIVSSSALLNTLTSKRLETENASSFAYKNALTALSNVNNEINNLNALVKTDASGNYRGRAYEQQANSKNLNERREKLVINAERLATAAYASTDQTFGVPFSLSVGGYSINVRASTVTSISLHILCVFAVLAVTAWKPEKRLINVESEHRELEKPENVEPVNTLDEDQRKLANDIATGTFGENPVMRKIIKDGGIKGGFKRVSPVFIYLENTGVLKKDGARFKLA